MLKNFLIFPGHPEHLADTCMVYNLFGDNMALSKNDSYARLICRLFNLAGFLVLAVEVGRMHFSFSPERLVPVLPGLIGYGLESILLLTPPPNRTVAGKAWSGYFYCLAGMFLPLLGFMFAPVYTGPVLFWVGTGLGLLAVLIQLYSLCYLRRSFTVAPESRRLVTDGPYARVRHPLYSAYMLWCLGSLLASPGWRYGLLLAAVCTAQYARAKAEETHLCQYLPGYAEYAARVPAFIPVKLSKLHKAGFPA